MALLCPDDEAVEAHPKVDLPAAPRATAGYGRPVLPRRNFRWATACAVKADNSDLIRVVVADDDHRFRRVVAALLSGEDGIQVVGQASDGRAAVAQVLDLRPDLVLLDVRMPEFDGIGAAREIHRLVPDTKVVMFTGSEDGDDLQAAMRAGAHGYLLKEDLLKDVAGALRLVARGGPLLIARSVAPKLLGQRREPSRCSELSERELEVLRLMSLGYANLRIADELCLSPHTVKRHVANILAKLQQRSRGDAVLHAVRAGVLTAQAS